MGKQPGAGAGAGGKTSLPLAASHPAAIQAVRELNCSPEHRTQLESFECVRVRSRPTRS